MRAIGIRLAACALAATLLLSSPGAARALNADYDFTISYSGMTIRGRLVGLALDDGGNAAEAAPAHVLIYQAPAITGMPASDANPFVFDPYYYGRITAAGTQATTAPGVYGFRVSNFQIMPVQQDLLLSDSGYDVFMEFNYGSFSVGRNWGLSDQEGAIWPSQNTGVSFTLVGPLGVDGGAAPARLQLAPARPNPTRGATSIAFTIPRDGRVVLDVLDTAGRRVRTLNDGSLTAGLHEVPWDGRGESGAKLSPGVYHARLTYEGGRTSERIVVFP